MNNKWTKILEKMQVEILLIFCCPKLCEQKIDEDFRENARENFANSLLPKTFRINRMDGEFRENARKNLAF